MHTIESIWEPSEQIQKSVEPRDQTVDRAIVVQLQPMDSLLVLLVLLLFGMLVGGFDEAGVHHRRVDHSLLIHISFNNLLVVVNI